MTRPVFIIDRQDSQRYNTNELYKPRINYRSSRRGAAVSPPVTPTVDAHNEGKKSEPDKKQEVSSVA